MADESKTPERPASDRRAAARIPVEMWVEETSAEGRYFRKAGNLSRLGLRLDHTIPLTNGTRVSLGFTLPGDNQAVRVIGEIVTTGDPEDLGMGVRFIDMSPADRERIDAYLRRAGVGGV